MKNYDNITYTCILLFVGCYMLFSCSTVRHSDTVTSVELRDSSHTELRHESDILSARGGAGAVDSLSRRDSGSGSLRIERDSAGLPILYLWQWRGLSELAGSSAGRFELNLGRHHSSGAECAVSTSATDVEKKEDVKTKAGPTLEGWIATGLILVVVLYLLYTISENVCRILKRK